MKKIENRSWETRRARGFTLVELLVVIAIIGILAGLLLPVLVSATKGGQKGRAKVEMAGLVTAIQSYVQDYSRFPTTQGSAADYTYTTNGTANAEVIAILMDNTSAAGGVNANHVKNPKQFKYLTPKPAASISQPGVGPDGIYRDPWGNPYVISMDLNYDGVCEDATYKLPAVSGGGLNGLVLQGDGYYGLTGTIMVWSCGPDGQASSSTKANAGVNQDNVLSWQ